MNELPLLPIFPPKRGLTDEEKRKVKAWERAGKIKECPAVGSPELLALGDAKERKWLAELGQVMKARLGLIPQKIKKTAEQKRERSRERHREWRRKRKEKGNG